MRSPLQARGQLLVPVLLSLILSACSAEEEKKAQQVQAVKVVSLKEGPASIALNYSVTLRGSVEVRVFSQIPDRIRSLNVEAGDRVSKGQLIAVIAHSMFSSGLEAALAGHNSARAQLESLRNEQARLKKLHDAQAVGSAQLERIDKQVQASEASQQRLQAMVNQAASQQSKAFVRAPISGVIGQRFLEQGDMAVPQIPIVTIVQMDELKAELKVPEFELPRIEQNMKRGYPVLLRSAGFIDQHGQRRSVPARIVRVSPTIDLATRMATVEVRMANADNKLRPGMLAEVEVVVQKNDSALLVPAYAVLSEGVVGATGKEIEHVVYVAQDQVARRRPVTLGMRLTKSSGGAGQVEVTSGLSLGDKVIVRGQHLLKDGDEIELPSPTEAVAEQRSGSGADGGGGGQR